MKRIRTAAPLVLPLLLAASPEWTGTCQPEPPGAPLFDVSWGRPSAGPPGKLDSASLAEALRGADVDALEKLDAIVKLDAGAGSPGEKARAWRDLARNVPSLAGIADRRAGQWESVVLASLPPEDAARAKAAARDKDWGRLQRLLALGIVPEGRKRRWSEMFLEAYGRDSASNPYAARLSVYAATPAAVEWVSLPGGSFLMGSATTANEKPVHPVTVGPFQIAKTEVTNRQYRACVEAGACTPPGTGCEPYSSADTQPVLCVDWSQARAFAEWVGGRLPTEAEWEYAARSGGKDKRYPWGDEDVTCDRAITGRDSNGCGRNATWPVCSKPKGNTEQGLCDMAGNIWEWVQDGYHGSYEGAPADGSAWEKPPSADRVIRGGSWSFGAGDARTTFRTGRVPGSRGSRLGFRPAR